MFLLAALLASNACECSDTDLFEGAPIAEIDKQALDFGAVKIGESKTLQLEIANTGTAILQLESITATGDGFSLVSLGLVDFSQLTFPYGIAQPKSGAGSTATLVVAFAPQDQQQYAGQLIITTSDTENPEFQIQLTGEGQYPDIEVAPLELDFGQVRTGSSATLEAVITNKSEVFLIMFPDQFHLQSADPDSPFSWQLRQNQVAGLSQTQVEVAYSPLEVKVDPITHMVVPDQDSLLIYSDDPDENPVEIFLKGEVWENLPPLTGV